MNKTVIIGGGNLGTCIAEGLLNIAGIKPADLYITCHNPDKLNIFRSKGVNVTTDNALAVRNTEFIFLTVKPFNLKEVLSEIKNELDPTKHKLISCLTATPISRIYEYIDTKIPVFRAMPNIAISIAESMTLLATVQKNIHLNNQVIEYIKKLGKVVVIEENLMDAATVLAACGIAYVLRFTRAMIQGGVEIGFDVNVASQIANQTIKGASELLLTTGQHPEKMIDKVTTPKGCTIAGLNEMEHQGFSSALIKGIMTSYQKIQMINLDK